MAPDEYYNLLGVDRSVTREALRCAFRKMVLNAHPDHNPDDTLANERTRKLIEAYKAVYREAEFKEIIPRSRGYVSCNHTNIRRTKHASSFLHALAKLAAAFAITGVLAFSSLQIMHGVLANQSLVFKPNYISEAYPAPTPVLAATIDPDPLDASAWYAEKEYRLTLGGRFATDHLIATYSQAARRAAAQGNRKLAQFYKATIRNIEDCNRAPFGARD